MSKEFRFKLKGKEYDTFNVRLYQCSVENLRYFIQQ